MTAARGSWGRAVVFFAFVHLVAVISIYVYGLVHLDDSPPPASFDAIRVVITVLLFPLAFLSGTQVGCGFGLVLILATSVLWGMALATIYFGLVLSTAYMRQHLANRSS